MTLNTRLLRALFRIYVGFLVLWGISIEAKLSIALRELRITIFKLSPRILFIETIVTLTSWLLVLVIVWVLPKLVLLPLLLLLILAKTLTVALAII